ncbi:carotenoid ester lipase precursor [Panaeolus papilionaceus]|nr:carotenoid ester lipase precursor [Panaeolus papilionaceus]
MGRFAILYLLLLSIQAFALPQGDPKLPGLEGIGSLLNPLKPVVLLDKATVVGKQDGLLSKFLGIPFSKPLERYRVSELNNPYKGTVDARKYGPICPQQKLTLPKTGIQQVTDVISEAPELNFSSAVENEDCLSINVISPPAAALAPLLGKKLPVLVWIHGGAAQVGDTASYDTMGSRIVLRSLALGEPIIFVSMNYRLAAYGFLGGAEVADEQVGNLGLRDQRLALRWVNKYIGAFGGDKNKVALWGQSSGAVTASLQMLSNDGNNEGLFRAAILQSGSPIHTGNVRGPAQFNYDRLVTQTGCTNTTSTLDCLRKVPFEKLKAAVDTFPDFFSYQSLVLSWQPTVDGVFLSESPNQLIPEGKIAQISVMSGMSEDEGTLFALSSLNVTNEEQFRGYIGGVWNPFNTPEELEPLWSFYPPNPVDGAPFNTGTRNALTPEFKRVAAYIGDAIQTGPRRVFLSKLAQTQKVWAYFNQRDKDIPALGSYHGSDLATGSKPGFLDDHIINFVVKLDPNVKSGPKWQPYSAASPEQYTFPPTGSPTITLDNFRTDAVNFLLNVSSLHPF